jgi:hypothetical protein
LGYVYAGKSSDRFPCLAVRKMDGEKPPDGPEIDIVKAPGIARLNTADDEAGSVDVLPHQPANLAAAIDDVRRPGISL